MGPKRRRQALIAGIVIVVVLAVYEAWSLNTSVAPRSSSNRRGRTTTEHQTAAATAPDVHLNALDHERPRPGSHDRNLFRFKPKPPPPVNVPPRPVVPVPTGPPSPPPLPPIALKFIGILDAPAPLTKIAVLSDGRNVFHGREGDIIEGRYRILRIGVESIEMAYLDGRGRQTIRLTGS